MMEDPRPTAVSLFTGAGGLDVGLERAGFRTVSANDFDADCIRTLLAARSATIPVPGFADSAYLEATSVVEGPIEELQPRDLRPSGAGSRWSPALLVGGPPCQPFSSSGKMRGLDDPRGRLFEHFVRIADGLRPRIILFENVRGLVTMKGPSGAPGEALALVASEFEAIGYATTFALLNSADYGAPQRRVRMFMIGVRAGRLPDWPPPSHSETPTDTLFDKRLPWVPLSSVLGTLPEPDGEAIRPSPALAEALRGLRPGTGLKTPGVREATRPGGHWGYKQGTFIADPSRPARTVTASATQDWVRDRSGNLRRLSWRECAALQGFPPEWPFQGNMASKYRQIGNAVPSVFGEALGREIASTLMTPARGRPASAPLPPAFVEAIRYTARENERNGESRRRLSELIAAGGDPKAHRGLGRDERQLG